MERTELVECFLHVNYVIWRWKYLCVVWNMMSHLSNKHVDGTMGCNNDDDYDLLRWKEGSAWRQKGFSRLEGGVH